MLQNLLYNCIFIQLPRRNILPPTRYFYVHKGEHGVWEPEKSDHPMIGTHVLIFYHVLSLL